MTSDLEDGEIEDLEEANLAEASLAFAFKEDVGEDVGEDEEAGAVIERERRSSSPYSPTNGLSPLQLETPEHKDFQDPFREAFSQGSSQSSFQESGDIMDVKPPPSRMTGGFWAPLSSSRKINATAASTSEPSEESADAKPASSSSTDAADSLLQKYRDIREKVKVRIFITHF